MDILHGLFNQKRKNYSTFSNAFFIAPHTGHLSGGSPSCVYPQTEHM